MNMGAQLCLFMKTLALNLTRPSLHLWICGNIKLPRSADGGEIFKFCMRSQVVMQPRNVGKVCVCVCVCVCVFVCVQERRDEMVADKQKSRSREALQRTVDSALGQEAG